ncbi:uncharacterized protein B0P05DRAFT_524656 [Gilbertella persicaria]|uniref:Uncharacterized protein n=1 Tax=Rhizopus stolonifer TaxID=4846 RepID=A0A367KLX0_RHIST|nr:uncharacterized protein B0P05DRAFT_524656 [Gilbertella persicaria]KAI8095093.1 hypothetical protein B0P05DRAFT_524656 [Gilbertella persicaria]RCI03159.1 hypothetical protein CU098_009271 [Rhizopus stolonifer]
MAPSSTLSLPNNKMYSVYVPDIIFALIGFYGFVYVLKFVLKICRRFRKQKHQAEKQRLKKEWTTCMTKVESSLQHPSLSSITLHPYDSTVTLASFSHQQRKRRLHQMTHYFHLDQAKKLGFLWQWSVSMGYCEYGHAARLNRLVLKLQDELRQAGA